MSFGIADPHVDDLQMARAAWLLRLRDLRSADMRRWMFCRHGQWRSLTVLAVAIAITAAISYFGRARPSAASISNDSVVALLLGWVAVMSIFTAIRPANGPAARACIALTLDRYDFWYPVVLLGLAATIPLLPGGLGTGSAAARGLSFIASALLVGGLASALRSLWRMIEEAARPQMELVSHDLGAGLKVMMSWRMASSPVQWIRRCARRRTAPVFASWCAQVHSACSTDEGWLHEEAPELLNHLEQAVRRQYPDERVWGLAHDRAEVTPLHLDLYGCLCIIALSAAPGHQRGRHLLFRRLANKTIGWSIAHSQPMVLHDTLLCLLGAYERCTTHEQREVFGDLTESAAQYWILARSVEPHRQSYPWASRMVISYQINLVRAAVMAGDEDDSVFQIKGFMHSFVQPHDHRDDLPRRMAIAAAVELAGLLYMKADPATSATGAKVEQIAAANKALGAMLSDFCSIDLDMIQVLAEAFPSWSQPSVNYDFGTENWGSPWTEVRRSYLQTLGGAVSDEFRISGAALCLGSSFNWSYRPARVKVDESWSKRLVATCGRVQGELKSLGFNGLQAAAASRVEARVESVPLPIPEWFDDQ